MLSLSVRGFLDYAGPSNPLAIAWLLCCLPPTRNEVGILIYGLFAAQWPRPPMPLSTLQAAPRGVACKTRGQDGFATSFPVGLLHPLQHAGLARRTPDCPPAECSPARQRTPHHARWTAPHAPPRIGARDHRGPGRGSPFEAYPFPVPYAAGLPPVARDPQALQLHLCGLGTHSHWRGFDDGIFLGIVLWTGSSTS